MNNILIAYFSASGVTAKVASELAQATGGELHEIIPCQAYTDADLNWHDSRSQRPATCLAVEDILRKNWKRFLILPGRM